MNHSPGPWRFMDPDPHCAIGIEDANGEPIFTTTCCGCSESNCGPKDVRDRELVRAAPEMLELLREIDREWPRELERQGCQCRGCRIHALLGRIE